MSHLLDRALLGSVADEELLPAEDRLDLLRLRLNLYSTAIALTHLVFTLVVGLYELAAILMLAAVVWFGVRVLMLRGHSTIGNPLQHATGLGMLTAAAVVTGPELNVQLAYLLAAGMPPLIWETKHRRAWWIHLSSAVLLWATVESRVFESLAIVQISNSASVALRIEVGIFIFLAFAFLIHTLIRANHRTESRLQDANDQLQAQIRERVVLEAQLEAARDIAQQADATKSDFLANMSHEIRTPMNTIIGLAVLCRRSEMSDQVQDYITRIRSSSQALLRIINDILDLSKIEGRLIELDVVEFDLVKVLEHLRTIVNESANAKGLDLEISVAPGVPRRLLGDPLRLGQVLTNLTSNAIKFTPAGSVTVTAKLIADDGEQVRLHFAVEDTGIGIPAHRIDDLFESFVQADRSTTRRYGGSGLGLTISKRLVELMGGQIKVESEIEEGSVFSFELPCAKGSLAEVTGVTDSDYRQFESAGFLPELGPIVGSRVLLVEDDEANQKVAAEILRSAGLEVTIANDGVQAVAAATEKPFDLILMDVHMPELDGPSAAAALRTDSRTAHLPIVAMTADVFAATRTRCFESGMNDFVTKPISVAELLTTLVRWIGADPERVTEPQPLVIDTAAAAPASKSASHGSTVDDEPTTSMRRPAHLSRESWIGRLSSFGIPGEGPPELLKRRRLAHGLVLALIAIAAVYAPVYVAAGMPKIAATTAAMGIFWGISYGLLLGGWHRTGRILMTATAVIGCFAYALMFGPQANYHALLFNGAILPPIIFTLRERFLIVAFALLSMTAWIVVESGALASLAVVDASATAFALLHANATLICFGFLAFAVSALSRENHAAVEGLRRANSQLQDEVEERLRTEVALMKAREKAEDARRAKSDFLANMSHEIRTPMNAILGLTELTLRCELTASVRDQVSRIQSSAQNLLHIVNDILDISRIEAQRIDLETVDFNLDQVLDELAGTAGHAASARGIEFLVDIDLVVPHMFRGDPLRLGQILSNLADNAIAMTQNGEIVVSVEVLDESPTHADLRFSVSDTGVGFPFNSVAAFSAAIGQTSSPSTDRRPGSGLGLILAARLVELMGGRLQVDSDRPTGSRFWYDIRLEQGEGDETISAPPARLLGTRILITSSNPTSTRTMCRMAEVCGFVTTTANDDDEAQPLLLEAAESGSPFKVVVIDRKPGGTEHIEVPPQLAEGSNRPAQLLLVTARDRADLGSPSQMDGILVKPVRRKALFDAVLACLGHVLTPPDDDMPCDVRSNIRLVHGARILVVEDNEANQIVARGMLEDAGFRVDIAGNGRDAVEAVTRSRYDLVFMDLHMPQMDGYEATKMIRSDPNNAELPIVAMTADARTETRVACTDAGMTDHVTKPLDRMALLANLVSWIPPLAGGDPVASASQPTAGNESAVLTSPRIDTPSIDIEEALDRLSGRRETLADVLASFKRRHSGRESEIEDALLRGDRERAIELAHQIKGSAGNISAHGLFNASVSLEAALRQDEEARVSELVIAHRDCLENLLESLGPIERSLRETASTSQRQAASSEIDSVELQVQFEELIMLLDSRSLSAPNVFGEIRIRLSNEEPEEELDRIAASLAGLDFAAARKRILELASRQGFEIDARAES